MDARKLASHLLRAEHELRRAQRFHDGTRLAVARYVLARVELEWWLRYVERRRKGMTGAGMSCRRCGKQLSVDAEVWLVLDADTETYRKKGSLPEARIRGEALFCKACAAAELLRGSGTR